MNNNNPSLLNDQVLTDPVELSQVRSNQLAENQQNKETSETNLENLTLSEAVEGAVSRYVEAMEGQEIKDLYDLVLSEVEVPLLECILKSTDNNQSQTATILGLNRGTLRKKLKKYDML